MAEMTWEKSPAPDKMKNEAKLKRRKSSERLKFVIGGLLILGAVAYLIISNTFSGARYFKMVDDVVRNPTLIGQSIRLTGAVLGDTIEYDAPTGSLTFTIVHIPSEYENLAETLHAAVTDPTRTQLVIQMADTTMPDLLQHEAQAILTGELGIDGIFYATELNLKCPTRFAEHTPAQLANQE
jgi:cytochrome c-type biogenesis protein CcmE